MATMASPQHFMRTLGQIEPVWVQSSRPQFAKLTQDANADVCIVGSGIASISTAYELVNPGAKVIMLEAQEVLSGESGRNTGHLSSALENGHIALAKKQGNDTLKLAAESHTWALRNVGDCCQQIRNRG